MLTNLVEEFKTLVKDTTDIDEVVNAILLINKKINRYVYHKSQTYQKSKKRKDDTIQENLSRIFEFADYFMDHFMAIEEEDLNEFCTQADDSDYPFTRDEIFEKFVEIWNGFPPFMEMVKDVSDEMDLISAQEEIMESVMSFANTYKHIMPKEEELTLMNLKKKFSDIKSNKKLLYVNQEFELPLEYKVNRFSKPGQSEKADETLENILLHFLNSDEGILLVVMEHASSSDEVFGLVSVNKDWFPLPTEIIEGMYHGILDISENSKTDFVALTLNK